MHRRYYLAVLLVGLTVGTTMVYAAGPPSSLSGVFKGVWTLQPGMTEGNAKLLSKDSGNIFFDEIEMAPTDAGLHSVEGRIVLRDGFYATSTTTEFWVQGAYFSETGVLLLIGNPTSNMMHNVSLHFELPTHEANEQYAEDLMSAFLSTDITFIDKLQHPDNTSPTSKCYLKAALLAKPYTSEEPFISPNVLEVDDNRIKKITALRGTVVSPNCGLSLEAEAATLPEDHYYRGAVNYVIIVYIVNFVETFLLVRQMDASSTPASTVKIAPLLIGVNALLDSYLCLIHLIAAIVFNTLFYAFTMAAFLQFIKFSLFEMRFLLTIWKARNPALFARGWEAMRSELSLLYIKFYGFLVGGFLLIYYMNYMFFVVVLLLYSFWVPQIISNIVRDHAKCFSSSFVVGTSICRLAIPIYFFGYSGNFIHIEPHLTGVCYLCSYVILQVILMHLQDFLGPRFFIPAKCLPAKYDYHRAVSQALLRDSDCVICMNKVEPIEDPEAPNSTSLPPPQDDPALSERTNAEMRRGRYMITPCNHHFHTNCLMQWLDYKLECPTCRAPLPYP